MSSHVNRSRLFWASCVALVVTAMTFAIRAGILAELGGEFGLSDRELGFINSMAFLGFPIATILGGLLYNQFGPRTLTAIAFGGHILGLVLTAMSTGFWGLFGSTFLIGFANGMVEAALNPMIADMFPERKTTMLNRFHVWFPGGMVIGSLVGQAMSGLSWQSQILVMLIPTAFYGVLFWGQAFPDHNSEEKGSLAQNLRAMLSPVYLLLLVCMFLTATTELGTQQWVEKLLGQAGAQPLLVLALVTGVMALGRFFAGPVVHRLSPPGMLWGSAMVSALGIYLMSMAEGEMVYLAAVVFAIGVCYFWPTMIGSVAEYAPRSGAIGMSILGGAGMFATSVFQPIIGGWLDTARSSALADGLTPELAELAAGQATLGRIVVLPIILIFLFGGLYFYLRKQKPESVSETVTMD